MEENFVCSSQVNLCCAAKQSNMNVKTCRNFTIFIVDGHCFAARLAAVCSDRLTEILAGADISPV